MTEYSKRDLTILTNSEKERKRYREANSEDIKASEREYCKLEIDP